MLGLSERMMLGMRALSVPDPHVVVPFPGAQTNSSGVVNDPKLTEMIKLQRRPPNVAKRCEIVMAQAR